ncbi:restriction endonuclease subunit S [Empedobacter sp.]|uniref:restriction endonuclease subunit S n=1 Tax=Empedobacter sp. TaxID=1927715 RepID=UPI0028AB03DB|nr:restriction endonuclease subunit S [Empedobacter sp.]
MSKLEELLLGVKVEWLALGDVCQFRNGYAFKSKLFKVKGLPIIRITNIDGFNIELKNVKYFDINDYQSNNLNNYVVDKGDILIAMSGATTGKIGIYNSEKTSYINQRVGKFIPDQNLILKKYLFHNLLLYTNFIYELAGGGAQPNLSSNMLLSKLQIPIPCPNNPEKSLEIQQEIVRILDQLTETTNNLKTELENERQIRKKQFEFYREELFTFEEGEAEWKTLGDITQIITKGTTPKIFSSNGINFIKIESFNNNKIIPNKFMFISKEIHEKELKRSILKSNDILFAIAGATIGKCAIVSEDILPANTNQALAIIRLNENINLKYIFNFLQSLEMKKYIEKFNKTSAQPNLNLKQISDFKIPIPSIEEQERIVNLLDQFDAAHTAIEEELTNEIKLRTQQYEYYREKLLTFPKN